MERDALDEILEIPTRRGLGDNQPPDEIALLRERLQASNASLVDRRDELLAGVDRVPEMIDSEELGQRVADFIRQIAACRKAADVARVAAKEPYLAGERAVDGFFRAIIDPLDRAKTRVEGRLTAYQRRKAEAERLAREEEARRQREAAEAARREAEEAERQALELERAARRKAQEEKAALDAAVAASERARQAEADAAVAAKAANAKPAELSRTRGDYGAVASLRTFFDFRELDRQRIDLETLRPYLQLDAIERAVRAYIRAGGRKLDGVVIFENTATAVR